MELKETLLTAKSRLFEAAKEACSDKAFAYDALYLAVIKIKRKYKKIVNKDHVIDLCIAEMKQPKKHVKQSFESVEDCIEKAMAAKVVPWKPIISAVAAVVLAAAIIVPFWLPENVGPTEVGGFEMENTISIGNGYSDNGTYLKNLHKVEDFGGPDLTGLIGTDMTQYLNGLLYHDMVTTKNDITYMLVAYAITAEKRAEFILYRAEKTGWVELGRADIGFFTKTIIVGGAIDSYYSIEPIKLLLDQRDAVYIVSAYNEGVQIHKYNERDGFTKLGQQKLADQRHLSDGVMTINFWHYTFDTCFDSTGENIFICYSSRFPFLSEHGNNLDYGQVCFVTYNLKSECFSEAQYFDEDFKIFVLGVAADGSDGCYLLILDRLSTLHSTGILNNGTFLYHLRDGSLSKKLLIHDENMTSVFVRLFEVDESGTIHIVYQQSTPEQMHYVQIQNDVVTKTYLIPRTENSPARHDFISFYREADVIYFTEILYNEFLTFAKCVDGKTTKLADLHLPQWLDVYYYISDWSSSLVSQGCILNLCLTSEFRETYFAQIICNYEES